MRVAARSRYQLTCAPDIPRHEKQAGSTYQRWTMSLAAMPRLFSAEGLAPARMSNRATSMLLVYLRGGYQREPPMHCS